MEHRSAVKSLIFASLVIVIAVTIVLMPSFKNINTERRSKASVGDLKPITGTFFMQDFNAPSATTQRAMVREMSEIGIDTIILLAAGTLEKNASGFKETISVSQPASMYRMLMPLAREFNMKIYMGLSSADYQQVPYWIGTPTDTNSNQGRIIDYSLRLIDATKQAALEQNVPWDTIAGFYISTEAGPAHFTDPNSNEILFYGRLASAIKAKEPTKKILLSPWLLEETTYDQAKQQYINLLRGAAIDVLAPQDSMGSLKVTSFGRNADHFRALHDAVAQFPGREAWANIETQLQPSVSDGNYNPSTILRIQSQISSAKPHVSKMITWIYQHTLLSDPGFDSLYSWTGQYTPARAAARKTLRQEYMNTYVDVTCAAMYYCDTTSYSCKQTSAEYKSNHSQCTNSSVSCEQNLASYISGRTTGACYSGISNCQQVCINPNPTAIPTNIPTSTPTAIPTHSPIPTKTPTHTPTPLPTRTPTPTVFQPNSTNTPTPTSGSLLSWLFPTNSPTPSPIATTTPMPTQKPGAKTVIPTRSIIPTNTPTPTSGSLLSSIMPKKNPTSTPYDVDAINEQENQADKAKNEPQEATTYEPELRLAEGMSPANSSIKDSGICQFLNVIPVINIVTDLFCK